MSALCQTLLKRPISTKHCCGVMPKPSGAHCLTSSSKQVRHTAVSSPTPWGQKSKVSSHLLHQPPGADHPSTQLLGTADMCAQQTMCVSCRWNTPNMDRVSSLCPACPTRPTSARLLGLSAAYNGFWKAWCYACLLFLFGYVFCFYWVVPSVLFLHERFRSAWGCLGPWKFEMVR